ncbi:MAG: hypothetical protein IV090_21780 [Candidatus Sericytochromatia bacterium]|nr:hypothetical protein [Candidatus Sericytochromatia bacterium]
MPQLKAMAGFEHQLNALTQNRHHRSEEDYQAGIQALARAKAAGFQDKTLLKQACERLMSALQKNRNNPRPYIAMGYLLMISADRNRAKRYFLSALKLDPQNETAQNFLDSMAEAAAIELQAQDTLQRFERFQTGSDPDLQYQSLEKMIATALKQVMSVPHQTEPVLSPEALANLQAQSAELHELKAGIEKQIVLLENDVDTTPLYFQLHPLEVILRRYQKALKTSAEFLRLETEIAGLKQETCRLIQAANQRQEVGQGFDLLLDACDSLADQLDDFETRKISIQPLETTYHELLGLVRILQEVLDEKA